MSEKNEATKEDGFLPWIIAAVLICLLALPAAIWWDGKLRTVVVSYDAPSFSLADTRGGKTSLSDLKGKVWLADFILINCSSECPVVTGAMRGFQDKWKTRGLRLVSFALDAKAYPEERKKYAKDAGADQACWSFLTGDYRDLIGLGMKGFHLPDTTNGDSNFLHSSRITLVDSLGHIRGYYDGLNLDDLKSLDKALAGLLTGKPQ